MSDTILIIDDKDRVADRVKMALGESDVAVNTVTDARSAKQLLVQNEFALILVDVALGADQTAGLTLCKQLREHERFSSIPVILLSESLGEDLIQQATESGAQGLVGWPFPLESIRKRLFSLLKRAEPAPSANPQAAAPVQPAVATPRPAQTAAPAVSPPVTSGPASTEDKLKHAQHLLAMVLHNLKTSNLLDLVEIEDIPGIVLKLTQSVCGENAEPEKPQKAGAPSKESDVSLDLDSAFGIKK